MDFLRKSVLLITICLSAYSLSAQNILDACKNENMEKVKKLLQENPERVNTQLMESNSGYEKLKTPLHFAVDKGNYELCKYLLDHKANVNALNLFEYSPLHYAIYYKHDSIIKLLIDNGADIFAISGLGDSPSSIAIENGSTSTIKLLLDKGLSVNFKGRNGISLLHNAAKSGYNEVVKTLLKEGANIDSKTNYGKTALHFAAIKGHVDIIKTLIEHKINFNAKSLSGKTAYHIAIENKHKDALETLMVMGANTSAYEFPILLGDYLGQEKPGITPKLFAPDIVSTEGGEFCISFSMDGQDVFFTRGNGDNDLQTNAIITSNIKDGKWTQPNLASFSGTHFEFEPLLTPDGKIYYGSAKPLPGDTVSTGMHEWALTKTGNEWSQPELVDELKEIRLMYPTVSSNKNVYLNIGNEGLHVIEYKNGKLQEAKKLSESINGFEGSMHACIAPDESFLIFDAKENPNSSTDLYISFRNNDGNWGKAILMRDHTNIQKDANIANLSYDGKFLFYSINKNIYWISTKIIDQIKSKI